MNYVALEASIRPGRTDILHYSLFHGVSTRNDVELPNNPSHSLGDSLENPLVIDICGTDIAHIFSPSCPSLVVSHEVAIRLKAIPNLILSPVKFGKLVNYRYSAGDFSYYESKEYRANPVKSRPNTLLDRLPNDTSLHSLQPYYELVIFNMFNIVSSPEYNRRDLSILMPDVTGGSVTISYVPEVIDRYPIFWAMTTMIRQDIFGEIEKFINWDYFTHTIVDL